MRGWVAVFWVFLVVFVAPASAHAAIVIEPANPAVGPLGTLQFRATGATSPGLVWSLIINASGGSIDPTSGAYRAGGSANVVDRVGVIDALGNGADVDVKIGNALSMTPDKATVPPRGSVVFAAAGGTGGYVWSLAESKSGATIDPDTGAYTAGPTPSVVDLVRVRDSAGAFLEASITLGGGVVITPAKAIIGPRAVIRFTVSGGSEAGYVWKVDPNGSGATVSDTGVYVAGAPGGATDQVVVTDRLGNSASAEVQVGEGFGDVDLLPASPESFSIQGGGGCQSAGTTNEGRRDDIRTSAVLAAALAAWVLGRRGRQSQRDRTDDAHRDAFSR